MHWPFVLEMHYRRYRGIGESFAWAQGSAQPGQHSNGGMGTHKSQEKPNQKSRQHPGELSILLQDQSPQRACEFLTKNVN